MTAVTFFSLAISLISLGLSIAAIRSARRHQSISKLIKRRQIVPGAEVFDPRGPVND